MALGWKSFELTGSRSTLALVLLGHSAAMLATLLIGGALADRYPRRTLMIISDLARCACMVVLFAVDVSGNLELWSLIALAVLYGAGDGTSTRPTAGWSRSSSTSTISRRQTR